MSKTIAVIAAHPDDEVLGCGGTIAKHSRAGDAVHVLILAEGVTSRAASRDSGSSRERKELAALAATAHRASEILGVRSLVLHDFPDNRMDSLDLLDVVKRVEFFLAEVCPDVVYTHYAGDLNIDHTVTNQAVAVACRPIPGTDAITLLFFEVSSSTEWQLPGIVTPFMPNWFVDISDTVELKRLALETYASEMRPWPHARSLEAVDHLAAWRGASVGVSAAEAFILGRCVK